MYPLHGITDRLFLILIVLSAISCPAQSPLTNLPPGVFPAVFPPVPEYFLSRGQPRPALYITYSTNTSGVVIAHTNLVPEVKREIRPVPGGAIADFGRSTIVWPADAATEPVKFIQWGLEPDGITAKKILAFFQRNA